MVDKMRHDSQVTVEPTLSAFTDHNAIARWLSPLGLQGKINTDVVVHSRYSKVGRGVSKTGIR